MHESRGLGDVYKRQPPAITAEPSLILIGSAIDASSGIASVTVNGIPASSDDSFATWSVAMICRALSPGESAGMSTDQVAKLSSLLAVIPLTVTLAIPLPASMAEPMRVRLGSAVMAGGAVTVRMGGGVSWGEEASSLSTIV